MRQSKKELMEVFVVVKEGADCFAETNKLIKNEINVVPITQKKGVFLC
jgi:hypothetical protein